MNRPIRFIEPHDIAAIPTRYAGHLFRSRLEARWAAMFDQLKWNWVYEPIDLHGYIPDFIITTPAPDYDDGKDRGLIKMLVEVKSTPNLLHADSIRNSGWRGPFFIAGSTFLHLRENESAPLRWMAEESGFDPFIIGLADSMSCYKAGNYHTPAHPATLIRCRCGIGIYQFINSSLCRRCSAGLDSPDTISRVQFFRFWGAAHEATRWEPHA